MERWEPGMRRSCELEIVSGVKPTSGEFATDRREKSLSSSFVNFSKGKIAVGILAFAVSHLGQRAQTKQFKSTEPCSPVGPSQEILLQVILNERFRCTEAHVRMVWCILYTFISLTPRGRGDVEMRGWICIPSPQDP